MGTESDRLTQDEKNILLELARQALEKAVRGEKPPRIDRNAMTPRLLANGATFVTLTVGGDLRGCIGTIEPYQPLAEDVCEHAVAAGLMDHRFLPVTPDELASIHIEISRLTEPVPLAYDRPEDLPARLRPGVDGVVLIMDDFRRATFLPQVWEKIPDAGEFLSHLCAKMGADPGLWRRRKLGVLTYEVEEFHEQREHP
jgi:AmmeMemoRadiSam system protein A